MSATGALFSVRAPRSMLSRTARAGNPILGRQPSGPRQHQPPAEASSSVPGWTKQIWKICPVSSAALRQCSLRGPSNTATCPLRSSLVFNSSGPRGSLHSFAPKATSSELRSALNSRGRTSPSPLHEDGDVAVLREEASAEAASGLEPLQERQGSIHVILGPMFSGKTTELLRRVAEAKAQGRDVLLVKSHVDTRYAEGEVVSHSGQRMKCLAVASLAELPSLMGPETFAKVEVIAVDEAQFIQDLDFFSRNAADELGKTVILAGLDGDFLRRKFGALVDVVPLADTVTKLQASCQICGGAAMFTLRRSCDMRTELVGGADLYMPVCRRHFLDGQALVKALPDSSAAGTQI